MFKSNWRQRCFAALFTLSSNRIRTRDLQNGHHSCCNANSNLELGKKRDCSKLEKVEAIFLPPILKFSSSRSFGDNSRSVKIFSRKKKAHSRFECQRCWDLFSKWLKSLNPWNHLEKVSPLNRWYSSSSSEITSYWGHKFLQTF